MFEGTGRRGNVLGGGNDRKGGGDIPARGKIILF